MLLRLFAPFLPFVTEEVWSWWQDGLGPPGPVARTRRAGRSPSGDPAVLAAASVALTALRKAKSEQKLSMRAELEGAVVSGPAADVSRVEASAHDLRAAGRVLGELTYTQDEDVPLTVTVTLPA